MKSKSNRVVIQFGSYFGDRIIILFHSNRFLKIFSDGKWKQQARFSRSINVELATIDFFIFFSSVHLPTTRSAIICIVDFMFAVAWYFHRFHLFKSGERKSTSLRAKSLFVSVTSRS